MLVIIFHRLGPYHHARLNAVGTKQQVTALELCAKDNTYPWEVLTGAGAFNRVTLLDSGDVEDRPPRVVSRLVRDALDNLKPVAVAVPGWSSIGALAALRWCSLRQVPAIMMSDSTRENRPRSMWKEAVKRRVVNLASAGLVAGTRHAEYLADLGMSRDRIFLGYDVVDNDYFAAKAAEIRKQPGEVASPLEYGKDSTGQGLHGPGKAESRNKLGLPGKYFLVSARFIWEKNLPRLIEAYGRYRELAAKAESGKQPSEASERLHGPRKAESTSPQPSPQSGEGVTPWDLVLLGDGPLRSTIYDLRSSLGLDACVHLPGFKQYADIPAYYALAKALILPSISETWGLVVNEAMASGLPVLVSDRCGCATDLVKEGVNGFTFDPYNAEQLAQLMLKISTFNFPLSAFGSASRQIISAWGPARFAKGLQQAVEVALKNPPPHAGLLDRLLLRLLLMR